MLMVADILHHLLDSHAKMCILYSYLIINKTKNISSYRGKVVENYQILKVVRGITDLV